MLKFRLFLEAIEGNDIWFGSEAMQYFANWDALDSQVKAVILKNLARRTPEDQNEIFKRMSRINPQTAKLLYQYVQKNGARLQAQAQAEREQRRAARAEEEKRLPRAVPARPEDERLIGFDDPSYHAQMDTRPGAIDRYLQQKVAEIAQKYKAADQQTKARIIQAIGGWQRHTKELFRKYVSGG
jgi:hypothetical protein